MKKNISQLVIICFVACYLFFAVNIEAATKKTNEENLVPIGDIFSVYDDETPMVTQSENSNLQSAMLAGLLVSIFIVTGTGRVYYERHNKLNKKIESVQNLQSEIMTTSVVFRGNEIIDTLKQCEGLELEIATLQNQINLI